MGTTTPSPENTRTTLRIAPRFVRRFTPVALLLALAFPASIAYAQAGMQPYFTRDPGTSKKMPPAAGWETNDEDTYRIFGGERVWIAFENEGYDPSTWKEVTLTMTWVPDPQDPNDRSIASMTPTQERVGFREGDEGPGNPPIPSSKYPFSFSDNSTYTLQFTFPVCVAWERFQFTHRGGPDDKTDFRVHLTSSCWLKGDAADPRVFDVSEGRFGATHGMNGAMRITQVEIFPELVQMDLTATPVFEAPPESGAWIPDPVFVDPFGEPRPLGGVRFTTDGPGLIAGDTYGLQIRMADEADRNYDMFIFDADVGEYAWLKYYNERLPWYESFDDYEPGDNAAGQGFWKGWDDDPAFDAPITDVERRSAPNALDVLGDADLVREYEDADSGVWRYSAWQYIPSDFESGGGGSTDGTYFILLNTYDAGGPYHWSVQMQFDSNDGMLKVRHGDGSNTVNVPYETDRWVKIQTIVDLENDWTQVYYDDELITEYSWTGGITGEGGGALEIAAVDLYAQGSSSVYYDDLVLEPCTFPVETFEYLDLGGLAGQGAWTTWDENPAADGTVTDEQSHSPTKSVKVELDTDAVHEYCTGGAGSWSYSAWQYIPSDFESGGGGSTDGTYFILLNTYDTGGPYHWSVQMQFDSNDGMLKVRYGDGSNTINVPYETDRWVKIQTIVDLENDWTQIYYDDALITEYSWTGGISGEGGGAFDIAAVDLYAQGSSSVFYDDLVLEPSEAHPCEEDLDGSGDVGFGDILAILAAWGPCEGCPEDLDGDGHAAFGDILSVLAAWGPCD